MNTENMINVAELNLEQLVQEAYSMSKPQGMGMLHYEEGQLSEQEVAALINTEGRLAVSMDYVKGRSCKFDVFRDGNSLFINDKWYDHTESQLAHLIRGLS